MGCRDRSSHIYPNKPTLIAWGDTEQVLTLENLRSARSVAEHWDEAPVMVGSASVTA